MFHVKQSGDMVWDSNVDWITLSGQGEKDWGEYCEAFDVLEKIQDTQERHKPQKGRMAGYDMLRVGHIALGKNRQKCLIMLDSWLCGENYKYLLPLPGKCTRVDLAVTAMFGKPTSDIARDAFFQVEKETSDEERLRQYSLITSNKGGSTLGIGKRRSGQFGRLYDKSAQIGEGEICTIWRYEVELKKDTAQQVYNQIVKSKEIDEILPSYIWQWFAERMVEPVFLPTVLHGAIELRKISNSQGDTLKWIAEQVAPAINKLIMLGKLEQVERAIGFQINMFQPSDFNLKGDLRDGSE